MTYSIIATCFVRNEHFNNVFYLNDKSLVNCMSSGVVNRPRIRVMNSCTFYFNASFWTPKIYTFLLHVEIQSYHLNILHFVSKCVNGVNKLTMLDRHTVPDHN